MSVCTNCRLDPAGEDGLCDDCREIVLDNVREFEGALCARCDLSLTQQGYCPNEFCPFHVRRQDECPAWEYPGPEELARIRQLTGSVYNPDFTP